MRVFRGTKFVISYSRRWERCRPDGFYGGCASEYGCQPYNGKKKYEAVEKEVLSILEQSEKLRKQLIEAINKDVEAFDTVMAAYGLPKDTDEQKLKRSSKIQDALKAAIDAQWNAPFWQQKLCLCAERSQKLVTSI